MGGMIAAGRALRASIFVNNRHLFVFAEKNQVLAGARANFH
jgi:hypothetical protein